MLAETKKHNILLLSRKVWTFLLFKITCFGVMFEHY